RALTGFGTRDALPRLEAFAAETTSVVMKARTEQAMKSIQRRAGASQGGQMSLVQTEPLEGALSPASSVKGGEVSLKS
ncbi:MAG: hypothetical protein AAGM22_13955, partial [Acidobacteriota bacterium]